MGALITGTLEMKVEVLVRVALGGKVVGLITSDLELKAGALVAVTLELKVGPLVW